MGEAEVPVGGESVGVVCESKVGHMTINLNDAVRVTLREASVHKSLWSVTLKFEGLSELDFMGLAAVLRKGVQPDHDEEESGERGLDACFARSPRPLSKLDLNEG